MALPPVFSKFLGTSVNSLINFVYPPICHVCESYLQAPGELICKSCWAALPLAALPAAGSGFEGFNVADVFSLWQYSEGMQDIIHEIKFNRKKSLAKKVGNKLADFASEHDYLKQADLVIPLPLHRIRLRERGYNQSFLIAISIADSIGVSILSAVKRTKFTRPQALLSAANRFKNVDGAFEVTHPEAVAGTKVLLVDDVVTTGATLTACAHALQAAGVVQIAALTAAKA